VSNQPKYSAVLFAKNPPQVTKFYEELLSMKIIATDADHIVLDAPGFQLVVHGIPPQVAESRPGRQHCTVPRKSLSNYIIVPADTAPDAQRNGSGLPEN
jgi:hypothetical protein